ncbi:acyl-CoA Delta12-desaturase-like isoform X2 [Sitodiplosis mosellana]|uniref:acyl-CoA Delta12-desaturase-like isoform X2 n=1 Tax=Sitodiplosis mosellana TaxID=263140 RepID=UPI002443D5F2|nr:acyl-CoA Delta12-desaturase-like isoform X2 [Sitodiplosis mosellana]
MNKRKQKMRINDTNNNMNTSSNDGLKKREITKKNGENMDSVEHDAATFVPKIRWPDLTAQLFLHTGAIYGLIFQFYTIRFYTLVWFFALIVFSGFGITAGAHRLFSHKSYKANAKLRLLLTFLFTISGQRDAYTWAHDHRVHHKYTETDADPHDARRGFWFAHVGWLFLTPHPAVVAKRKVIDLSDLENDPIVMWQKRFYIPLFGLIAIAMPVLVPWYFWNEDLWASFWVNFNLRFCITLNAAFFVNSVAHLYGNKPYDRNIMSVESLPVALAAFGEGWHNYHHVFPWDYKTSELGNYKFNISTAFIDFMAKIGWARDCKFVSPEMVARRIAKTGDGTHSHHEDCVWGYGDADICKDDLEELDKMQS